MTFAHVGGLPVEEVALLLVSAGGVGAWAGIRALLGARRGRRARRTPEAARRPDRRPSGS
jgi:hypothetical protein